MRSADGEIVSVGDGSDCLDPLVGIIDELVPGQRRSDCSKKIIIKFFRPSNTSANIADFRSLITGYIFRPQAPS